MGYYVKKNFIIIITIVSVSVSGGRYVLFQSETVNNTTNITNQKFDLLLGVLLVRQYWWRQ
jgi:hypothetical protein